MNIGNKIKEYRHKEGLTQVQLAAKASISRSYFADIEKNRYNPSVETLKKIADALGIPIAELLTTEEKLGIAIESLDEINKTVNQYYESSISGDFTKELQINAETNLLLDKIKKLSEKDRMVVEVLVNQLLKEE